MPKGVSSVGESLRLVDEATPWQVRGFVQGFSYVY